MSGDLQARVERLERAIFAAQPARPASALQRILAACCVAFEVPQQLVLSPRRTTRVVECRQAAVLVARTLTTRTYQAIGETLMRDHSTIMHAHREAKLRLEADADFAARVQAASEIYSARKATP